MFIESHANRPVSYPRSNPNNKPTNKLLCIYPSPYEYLVHYLIYGHGKGMPVSPDSLTKALLYMSESTLDKMRLDME